MDGICENCNQHKLDIEQVVCTDPNSEGTWCFCAECIKNFQDESDFDADLQFMIAIHTPEVWQ